VSDRPLQRALLSVLGTTGVVVTTDPAGLAAATSAALGEIDEVDRACSRFRADSDLTRANVASDHAIEVSTTMLDAVEVACRAAALTDGDVDPTVGRALRVLGYDRDFAVIDRDGPPMLTLAAVPRWRDVVVDRASSTVCVPNGVELDLGATAKALAADRAARAARDAAGCGVLVSLGGDISVAGQAPSDGWPILLGDRHDMDLAEPGPVVAISEGGFATSSTSARRWRRGGLEVHHLIDPHTGQSVVETWRTVSVAARTCVDANIASTAAIIRGARALEWLEGLGLWARLVATDGGETYIGDARSLPADSLVAQ
jgi:thiamine biosynthesis lipoprotein